MGRLVLYIAYIDESDTHDASPTMTMAAFLGSARQWELAGRRLRKLQKKYGFSVFHATDFKNRKKEFAGWTDLKSMALVNDLTELVRDELTEGVSITLSRAQYLTEYRNTPFPRRMPVDSQYGVSFRGCLAHLVDIVMTQRGKNRLDVVVEAGHKNAGAVRTVFADIERNMAERGLDVLGRVMIAKKAETAQLMLADFLAHTFALIERDAQGGGRSYAERTAETPKAGDAGITVLNFPTGVLQGLKDQFERRSKDKMEEFRRQRAARIAVTPSSD